jgi:hypothetical protein
VYYRVHIAEGWQYWLTKPDITEESIALVNWNAVGVPRGKPNGQKEFLFPGNYWGCVAWGSL